MNIDEDLPSAETMRGVGDALPGSLSDLARMSAREIGFGSRGAAS
jgi:hypothetical protein